MSPNTCLINRYLSCILQLSVRGRSWNLSVSRSSSVTRAGNSSIAFLHSFRIPITCIPPCLWNSSSKTSLSLGNFQSCLLYTYEYFWNRPMLRIKCLISKLALVCKIVISINECMTVTNLFVTKISQSILIFPLD